MVTRKILVNGIQPHHSIEGSDSTSVGLIMHYADVQEHKPTVQLHLIVWSVTSYYMVSNP